MFYSFWWINEEEIWQEQLSYLFIFLNRFLSLINCLKICNLTGTMVVSKIPYWLMRIIERSTFFQCLNLKFHNTIPQELIKTSFKNMLIVGSWTPIKSVDIRASYVFGHLPDTNWKLKYKPSLDSEEKSGASTLVPEPSRVKPTVRCKDDGGLTILYWSVLSILTGY